MLLFVVAGLFCREEPHVTRPRATSNQLSSSPVPAAAGNATGSAGSAAPIGATGGEQEGADLGTNFVYDWAAYHAAFGDKPLDEAVTELIADCAHLYSRMTSRMCNTAPPSMTLSEASLFTSRRKTLSSSS